MEISNFCLGQAKHQHSLFKKQSVQKARTSTESLQATVAAEDNELQLHSTSCSTRCFWMEHLCNLDNWCWWRYFTNKPHTTNAKILTVL